MASERVVRILVSKTDISKEHAESLSENEAWRLVYSIRKERKKAKKLQICFTGFGVSRKKELIEYAENHSFHVVKSITKHLDFLCVGDNPGPVKLKKADEQGVQILNENQFKNLIETGESPENVD